MKKTLLLFLIFISCAGFSQAPSGYIVKLKEGDKYFISLAYGIGMTHWNSFFKSTEFYDKDGSVLNTGDFKFSANSASEHYDVNVMVPIKHIRLGLGIAFEFNYLSEIRIDSKSGANFLLFDEGLRFDKMYLQSEVPFNYDSKKKYTFNWNFKLGWFGYTNINRINFLGEKPLPVSLLIASGIIADYQIYPQVYFFIFPSLEYKLYDNSVAADPVQIHHNVYAAYVLAGLRFDLGRFY